MSVRFGHSVVWRIIFKVFKVTFFVVVFCVILYYYFWIYFDCIIFEFSLNLFPLRPKIDYKSYVYTVCHLGLLHALGLTFPLNFIQYKSENCSCCFLVFTLFMFSWSRLLLPVRFFVHLLWLLFRRGRRVMHIPWGPSNGSFDLSAGEG